MSINPMLGIELVRAGSTLLHDIVNLPKQVAAAKASRSAADSFDVSGYYKSGTASTTATRQTTGVAGPSHFVAIQQATLQSGENLAALSTELGNLFSAHGIDTSQSLTLAANKEGRLEVIGDHPQKAEIDALLARHPEYEKLFQQVGLQIRIAAAMQQDGGASGTFGSFAIKLENGVGSPLFLPV